MQGVSVPIYGLTVRAPHADLNLSVGLLLAGAALWLRKRPAWCISLGVMVVLPCALVLLGYLVDGGFEIDRLIARDSMVNESYRHNLSLIAYKTRYLIAPWVRVPHLASHRLARLRIRPAESISF